MSNANKVWVGQSGEVGWHCPGCGNSHAVDPKRWSWNGSLTAPTFQPSVLVTIPGRGVCHCFVKDGQIRFLSDCFHDLAGKTVEVPEDD